MDTIRQRAGYVETLIVLVVLSFVVLLNDFKLCDIMSAAASLLTFMCTQMAFDMNEELQAVQGRKVQHSSKYRVLFFLKECAWVITCIIIGSLPLIASTGVFASYPYWRRALRG